MPTPFRHRGFAYRIYRNDHPPPHVHVVGADGEAVVEIEGNLVRRHDGVTPVELLRILRPITCHRVELCAAGRASMERGARIDEDFAAMYARTRVEPGPDWARAAYYRPRLRVLCLELRSGVTLSIPARLIEILAGASVAERSDVRVEGRGMSLYWPLLDEGLSVPNLVAGTFGTATWMRELGRRGGSVTSPRKAAAARANGRKGGRPRRHAAGKRA